MDMRRTQVVVAGVFALGLSALGLGVGPAAAQTYPDKPIKLIVPFVPGSPVDILAGHQGRQYPAAIAGRGARRAPPHVSAMPSTTGLACESGRPCGNAR
jgi:tripartite-type tricarboxylate transporter receptor subunit TctC